MQLPHGPFTNDRLLRFRSLLQIPKTICPTDGGIITFIEIGYHVQNNSDAAWVPSDSTGIANDRLMQAVCIISDCYVR